MPYLNKVFLIGNLTRDPEMRQVGSQPVCAFGLAVSRTYTTARGESREDVCFIDVEAWGRTAEIISQYVRKGSPLFVEGRLRFDQWDDRETGKKRSRLTVTADNIQLMGSPRDSQPMNGVGADGMQQPYYQGQPSQGNAAAYYGQQPVQGYGNVRQGGYYQQPSAGYGVAPQPPAQGYAASSSDMTNGSAQPLPPMPSFQPPAEDDSTTPF